MRVSSISYSPAPDGPAQRITTHETSDKRVTRIRLPGAKLPEDRTTLQFMLKSVLGVEDIAFDNESVLVTSKPGYPWERICIGVCDHLVRAVGWKHHNTTINDQRPNWFARGGITSF